MENLRTIYITIHALTATAGMMLGLAIMWPGIRIKSPGRILGFYRWSMVMMVVSLGFAIVLDWPRITQAEKFLYSALALFAIYIAQRAFLAVKILALKPKKWRETYRNHAGFTVISLFEGFVIVAAIQRQFPALTVGIIAVASLVLGIWATGRLQHKAKLLRYSRGAGKAAPLSS